MSYSLDSDIQEDLRTFPMYQRLRKINPFPNFSFNLSGIKNFEIETHFSITPLKLSGRLLLTINGS